MSQQNNYSRTSASFPVRRMDYQFTHLPKYWCANDPIYTHFFTALSTLFPEGEAYFVRSVRKLRSQVQHNQQHGLNPESLEKITGITLKAIEKIFPDKWNLLLTVGVEHYTAVLVAYMMKDVNQLMTDETIRNLWLWHSIEETEHKAVAYDLYQELYGNKLDAYIPRVALFSLSLVIITLLTHISQLVLIKRDKQLLNVRSWAKFLKFGFDSYRIFTPRFIDFFRYDFHPNDFDESALVERSKAKIALKS